MSEIQQVNYPDVLGAITRGIRKNIDVVQCALSTRPERSPAGKTLESILLIQSMVDVEIDVRVEVELPQSDASRRKGVFFCKTAKLLVGLQPAEVGYVTLPFSCSPHTAPAEDYILGIKIEVKRPKQVNLIRQAQGGGTFTKAALAEKSQSDIETLQKLTFSSDDGKKRNYLQDKFGVLPPGGIASLRELKPGWVSLWTMQNYLDDSILLKRLQPELEVLTPQLNRQILFKPLLQTVQEHYKEAGYALDIAEVIYITKMLTLMVEHSVEQASSTVTSTKMPEWYMQMARVLFQEKRFANQAVYLITKHVFPALLNDSILHAFSMTSNVIGKSQGTPEELQQYADDILKAVIEKTHPLNFALTYLPLITGGIIANTRITMPREQVRDTLFMLSKAVQRRADERNEDNAFIFSMVDALVERGLEHF